MCEKVLNQNDFASVFEGILLAGDTTILKQPGSQIENEEQKCDVTGVWQSKYTPESPGYEHSWNLHLAQKDKILSGTLVVSYMFSESLSVVQQSVVGEINGDDVNFHDISYSFFGTG